MCSSSVVIYSPVIGCCSIRVVFVYVVTSTVLSDVPCSYVRCSSISFHAALIHYSGSRQPTVQSLKPFVIEIEFNNKQILHVLVI